jgi:hypothetical protein
MIDRKTSFFTGIILVLVFIILLQRACTPKCPEVSTPEPGVHVDTVYKDIVKTETKRVTIHKTDTQYVREPWMVPDTNYAALKQQFENLVAKYASKNIYQDTIYIDSIGTVVLTDTVRKNMLAQRLYIHNYKIPTITVTKTIPLPPKRQVYVGGAVGATYPVAVSNVQAGILFKNKKDQIFGLSAGLDTRGIMTYSLSSYWKISFKR